MVTRKPVPQNSGPEYADDQASLPTNSKGLSPSDGVSGSQYRNSYGGFHGSRQDLPESLRPGPTEHTPRSSAEMQRPASNPYMKTGQNGGGLYDRTESSANAWGESTEHPSPPSNAPPPPPVPKDSLPTHQFSHLTMHEPSTNPWQPALDSKPLPQQPSLPPMKREDSGNDIWSSDPPPSKPPPTTQSNVPPPPVLLTMPSEPESPAWDEEDEEPSSQYPLKEVAPTYRAEDEGRVWEENEQHRQQEESSLLSERVTQEGLMRREEALDSGFQEDPLQQSAVIGHNGWNPQPELSAVSEQSTARAPALPPRRSVDENPPPQPPRPVIDTRHQSTTSLDPPEIAHSAQQQTKEKYEIKKITWHDVNARQNPRTTPILIQNDNGPCPLLALVNALTLSTPAELDTPLVESLRTREQISLGLLLEAVIDELMSGRRGDPDMELPNVLDLHHFLLDLHTGMNVNPLYFPKPTVPINLMDGSPKRLSHIHPVERDGLIPGTFEETRETKLYSIFSIPMIHGWLPFKDSAAYEALFRSAKSYEEVQTLQFLEEELEGKLRAEGLSFEEQSTLEDIAIIKAFVTEFATQLTPYGLDTMMKSMEPGSFAILFRNNHFSTLYRHPINHQLLQLVTDMGYAGHEEVVWESLADVNGENCELFSGDFRLVGGAPSGSHQPEGAGWTTVPSRGNQSRTNLDQQSSSSNGYSAGTSQSNQSGNLYESLNAGVGNSNSEQEDHDLALALQLQEEEEQRQRDETARRRRETELSQQYIEQQGGTGARPQNIPVTNNRGGGSGTARRGRVSSSNFAAVSPVSAPRRNNTNPPAPAADPEAGVDLPPPSYDEAATRPAYNPPLDHPAHPGSSPNGHGRTTSTYSASQPSPVLPNRRASAIGGIGGPRVAGPPNGGRTSQQGSEQERDCVVM